MCVLAEACVGRTAYWVWWGEKPSFSGNWQIYLDSLSQNLQIKRTLVFGMFVVPWRSLCCMTECEWKLVGWFTWHWNRTQYRVVQDNTIELALLILLQHYCNTTICLSSSAHTNNQNSTILQSWYVIVNRSVKIIRTRCEGGGDCVLAELRNVFT